MKALLLLAALIATLSAETIKLPKPQQAKGTPIYEALAKRSTNREFSKKKLTDQQLSQILWSAAGVTRNDDKKRTAPSAWGNNEVSLYVLLEKGTFRYDPVKHSLDAISKEDNRQFGGKQDFVKDAPVTLVLVADLSKITQITDENAKMRTAHIDAGYVSQNIYLSTLSEGLVTGARAYIDFEKLTKVLKLSKDQRAIIAHSVGYAK